MIIVYLLLYNVKFDVFKPDTDSRYIYWTSRVDSQADADLNSVHAYRISEMN